MLNMCGCCSLYYLFTTPSLDIIRLCLSSLDERRLESKRHTHTHTHARLSFLSLFLFCVWILRTAISFSITFLKKKESRKPDTSNGDGTPPPHRDFKERGVVR